MKITLLSENFPPEVGAPQIRLYEISKELQKRGHQVEVITAFPHHPNGVIPEDYKGKFFQYELYDGIPVYRSWIYPSPKGSFWRRLISYFSFTFSAFYSVFKTKPTDVIICTSPPLFLGITGYFASKIKRARFVFNVADIWPESAVELGILTNKSFIRMAEGLERFLYRKAWKIAAATEGIQEYMQKQGKKPEDVFLLPNGVNVETFRPRAKDPEWIEKLGLENKVVFSFAGRHGYAQGLDSVLQAAKLIENDYPEAHFLFIGDGPEKEKLISLKDELGIQNVTFHDSIPVSEMPKVYSITDYSLVSLRNIDLFKGARPSKIFPALASGTPILYCGTGEAAKLIEMNECGIIATPEDSEDIAEKIAMCMEYSEDRYKFLSQNSVEFARKEYSWGKITSDLLESVGEGRVGGERG